MRKGFGWGLCGRGAKSGDDGLRHAETNQTPQGLVENTHIEYFDEELKD